MKPSAAEHTTKAATTLPDILCPESFQETVSNIKQHSNGLSGDFNFSLGNQELFNGSFLLRSRFLPFSAALPKPKRQNPLRVSYVAPDSFRNSPWATSGLDNPFNLLQCRGFKTERSIDAELKRNPTMTTRIRDVLSEWEKIHLDQTPFSNPVFAF